MSAELQDPKPELDAIEEDLELERTDPDTLLSRMATALLSLQTDSPHRPRADRLLGMVQARQKLDGEALSAFGEAKALAENATPPNLAELAKIGRQAAAVHAWRGDDMRAASELLLALAFASLQGDAREAARIIVDFACLESDVQRFGNVVLLLRPLVAQGPHRKLSSREALPGRISLCQALNRVGGHQEVLQQVAGLRAEVPETETRLHFLSRLEEARAYGGLGRFDDAERALLEAEALLPSSERAFERSQFLHAVTELHEVKGGPPAVMSLGHLIGEYAGQGAPAREAVVCRALASARFKLGENGLAREALAQGLRAALQSHLVDLADNIRADLVKSAGSENIEVLAEAADSIGGDGAPERRFVLLGRLGKGLGQRGKGLGQRGKGLGGVHRAIDLSDGQLVALKKVDLSGFGGDQRPAMVNAMKAAYAAARQIDDPRLARVLDLRMEPDGALHIVQRFVAGPTLGEVFGSGATPARLLSLLAGVADGLVVLHGRNIAHRDLKPENIIVVHDAHGDEYPVIVDLGIALVAGPPDQLDHFGTPPYVAPEQAAGEPADARADVYALGQMIAEIWGGQLPSHSTLGKLWGKDAPDAMPRAIGDLVGGMVETDPARRLSDLGSVGQALRAQAEQMASA